MRLNVSDSKGQGVTVFLEHIVQMLQIAIASNEGR